jgi:2-polyprenyl-3-methyl-5-hydroxy-6-metoxy-1,4-benzoquinol methylase
MKINTISIKQCNNCHSVDAKEIARTKDFEYLSCDNEFIYVQCSNCQLVYLKNRPALEELSIIYPPSYNPYQFDKKLGKFINSLRNYVQKGKIKAVKRYASKGAYIVDVGCGGGQFLSLMKKYGDKSWKLAGVDFSEQAINSLKIKGIQAFKGRFEEMAWERDKPDIIVLNQVIEHLDDPASVIEKAYNILKPNGVLIIETPSIDGYDAVLFKSQYWGGYHSPRHWTLYNEETLRFILENKKFQIIETSYLLSPTFWLQSFHHLIFDKFNMPRTSSFFDTKYFPFLVSASFFDVIQKFIRKKTSNFRMVARKGNCVGSVALDRVIN